MVPEAKPAQMPIANGAAQLAQTALACWLSLCVPPQTHQWAPLQAFACFSNALALESSHAETLMAAGALYKSCGLLPEALQSLEAAVKAQPKEPSYKQAIAVVLTDLGEPFVAVILALVLTALIRCPFE